MVSQEWLRPVTGHVQVGAIFFVTSPAGRGARRALYLQAQLAALASALASALAWTAGGAFERALARCNGVDVGLTCAIEQDRDGDGNDELVARDA